MVRVITVSGTQPFEGDAERVYALLTNPSTFVNHIDGCQKIDATGPDTYEAWIAINAMGLQTIQRVGVVLQECQPPQACTFVLTAKSQFGKADCQLRLKLQANGTGGTGLTYEGTATLSGLLASVGPRLVEVSVQRMLGQFFAKLAAEV